jgi:hypothetical protein
MAGSEGTVKGRLTLAKDLGHPVHRPVRAAGALVALQVAERQDAEFR